MVRFVRVFLVIVSLLLTSHILSCASRPSTTSTQDTDDPDLFPRPTTCEDDCVQPPLLRNSLVPFLMVHQERILAREDYLTNLPPLVRDVAFGAKPDGPLRDGKPVVDHSQKPYEGVLNWHLIDFEDVATAGVEDRSFRDKKVSAAHCYFARQPNRHTSIFALLVVHHPDRGDILYIGGPDHNNNRIDTVPFTDHHRSPLRVRTDQMHCAFRDDQNDVGALIIPFEYEDIEAPSNGPHYAVFEIVTSTTKQLTGKTQTITRSDTRGGEPEEVLVPVYKYGDPIVEFLGSYTSVHDALLAAEDSIPAGRFRLRRDFIYPRMPYMSYLGGEPEEFCPTKTECHTPPANLDVDVRATYDPPPEETTEDEESGEDSEESSESQ